MAKYFTVHKKKQDETLTVIPKESSLFHQKIPFSPNIWFAEQEIT